MVLLVPSKGGRRQQSKNKRSKPVLASPGRIVAAPPRAPPRGIVRGDGWRGAPRGSSEGTNRAAAVGPARIVREDRGDAATTRTRRYEPVVAHAGRLKLELPLALGGAVRLTVEDVDVYLRAASYAVDAEAARKAVEIAVNLYWANYLRPPQQPAKSDAGPSQLSDTLASVVRSAEVDVERPRGSFS